MQRKLWCVFASLFLLTALFTTTAFATTGQEYEITLSSSEGGTVLMNDAPLSAPVLVAASAEVTLTATPASGYRFLRWEITGSTLPDYEATKTSTVFSMTACDLSVSAVFEKLYPLYLDGNLEGEYAAGDTVNLSVESKKGKNFLSWQVTQGTLPLEDEEKTAQTLSFEMPAAALSLERLYEDVLYRFQVSVTGKGSVTVNGKTPDADGYYTCYYGERVTLTALPQDDYSFILWSGTSSIRFDNYLNEETFFTAPASDFSVKAQFASAMKKITFASTVGGRVTSPTESEVEFGVDGILEIAATPDANYVFSHWECSVADAIFADRNAALTEFTMPSEDCTLTAVFRPSEKKLTVQSSSGGKVQGTSGNIAIGTEIPLQAIPDEGFLFSHWECSVPDLIVTPNHSVLSFVMPSQDVTITAVFSEEESGFFSGNFPWVPLVIIVGIALLFIALIVIREVTNTSLTSIFRKNKNDNNREE